jgi:hypothetical protein
MKIRPFHKNHAVNLDIIMNNRQERLYFFLVVWFTMISSVQGWGQNPYAVTGKKSFSSIPYPGDLRISHSENGAFLLKKEGDSLSSDSFEKPASQLYYGPNFYIGAGIVKPEDLYAQPSNLYYIQSGFFCKREWELEKTTHIPFRFRLGSLADCNAMEGKH